MDEEEYSRSRRWSNSALDGRLTRCSLKRFVSTNAAVCATLDSAIVSHIPRDLDYCFAIFIELPLK